MSSTVRQHHCAVQVLSDPQLVGSGTPQQGAFRELNPADFLPAMR